MKIKIEIKNQFKPRAYPACDKSKLLCELCGDRQTFTKEQIQVLKKLGYQIEYSGYLDGIDYFNDD